MAFVPFRGFWDTRSEFDRHISSGMRLHSSGPEGTQRLVIGDDFSIEEYLDLQQVVYRVSEAVRQEVRAERMNLYASGSHEGNSHVHGHVVPLPPGVPYEEQQDAWRWLRSQLASARG